jgi:hypothetical protein
MSPEPEFLNFKEPSNRFQGVLTGRYDNSVPSPHRLLNNLNPAVFSSYANRNKTEPISRQIFDQKTKKDLNPRSLYKELNEQKNLTVLSL